MTGSKPTTEELLNLCAKLIRNPNGYNEDSVIIAYALQDRLQPSPPAVAVDRDGKTETGWVIEVRTKCAPPIYFDGAHFDSNHLKAVRFSRAQDATTIAALRLRDSGLEWEVNEHAWTETTIRSLKSSPAAGKE